MHIKRLIIPMMAVLLLSTGCSGRSQQSKAAVDGVSSASLTHYEDSSLSQEELMKAIENEEGGCTIATVNQDGSPNLIVAVPGVADENHLIFGWADNTTKANVKRTGQAMIAYYLYDSQAAEKSGRHSGARLRVELETDEAVLKKLFEDNPDLPSIGTVLKITEVLPLG